jgi:hypothetical protein
MEQWPLVFLAVALLAGIGALIFPWERGKKQRRTQAGVGDVVSPAARPGTRGGTGYWVERRVVAEPVGAPVAGIAADEASQLREMLVSNLRS